MKKVVWLALTLVMGLGLVACGDEVMVEHPYNEGTHIIPMPREMEVQEEGSFTLSKNISFVAPEGELTEVAKFIDEVCELNGISKDNTLHSGEYLVVSYYSPEIR